MKIALIIYVITIIFYWIGALSVLTSAAKYFKEHPKTKYHTTILPFPDLLELLFFLLPLF